MKQTFYPAFMSCCTRDDRLWFGLVAFVVGAVVLLQRFDVIPMETWDYLWPSILVVSGLKWMVASSAPSCDMSAPCASSSCNDCGMDACVCSTPVVKKSVKKTSKKKK